MVLVYYKLSQARQRGVDIRPDPLHRLLAMADQRQHRAHGLDQQAVVPLPALTQCEVGGIALRRKVEGAVEGRYMPPRLDYVWPLGPGKRWEQTYTVERPRDRETWEVARVFQVEGAETISVPAGSFQTNKIM